MSKIQTKFKAGRYYIPVTLDYQGDRIYVYFPYNKTLLGEVKAMEGRKWHGFDKPPKKCWSIANTARNAFQLAYLQGKNPYAIYDVEPEYVETTRPLYEHQKELVAHGLTTHYCIWACEMGTGKTLAAIELAEKAISDGQGGDVWYIGPRSGIKAVSREFVKWDAQFEPEMFTYEGLVKQIKNWIPGTKAPRVVIFDESSKIKTPTAQRSKAALWLANGVRNDWQEDGFVVLMSGTPAPKSPADWWHQCEVACPGFLKEGHVNQFKKGLCLIEERESVQGATYPHLVTWLDDERKCLKCGEFEDHRNHQVLLELIPGLPEPNPKYHNYQKSVNEVERLYRRMKGLVVVKFSKDCLDLPEIRYEEILVRPSAEILRTAKLIKKHSPRAVTALTLLRELSDGFQYYDEKIGLRVCDTCNGQGEYMQKRLKDGRNSSMMNTADLTEDDFIEAVDMCPHCHGSGELPVTKRSSKDVKSPKDDEFRRLLEEHEDIGRFIVWGGFTQTIDRLTRMANEEGWDVLQVDGRGYNVFRADTTPFDDTNLVDTMLDAMDASHPKRTDLLKEFGKVCFVGHPQAGGMALTLTASPTELFYSNSFSGEARMQAEKRFHRAGMDQSRGVRVIDLIHLPTDKLILENLKQKRKLQDISMGELEEAFSHAGREETE